MLLVFLLLLLEAGVTADVFLNRNWEEVYFAYKLILLFPI